MSQFLPSPSYDARPSYGARDRAVGSVRIGDAERDEAVALLGEHFVAGRLTQEEFEERSDVATRARYADDVSPLFADLPETPTAVAMPWSPKSRPDPRRIRTGPPPRFFFLLPILMIGLVVATVAVGAPWLLWMVFWFALFSRPFHHAHRHHHPHRR